MEKPHRQEYEDLLEKQEKEQKEERKEFVNRAHGEALEDEKKISGLTSEIEKIKKGKTGEEIESRKFEEAEEILGEDFLGPDAVKSAFNIEMEEIPEIPFTKEELERAKELNQQLILYVDKTPDGKPLTGEKLLELTDNKTADGKKLLSPDWYKKEDFFTKEAPRAGWKLISKETIPDSTSKNYVEQTEEIVSYLEGKVFKGESLPEEYQKAVDEFNAKKKELKKLTNSNWQKAAAELENIEITKLTRETPIEVLYRLALNERENKKRLLGNYTWTPRRSSIGGLVRVGDFDSHGVDVRNYEPDDSGDDLGVSFSRSF